MRRAHVSLVYEGVDISADVAPHLLSFEYSDHEGGKADDLRLRLEDRAGLWRSGWYPEKGSTITAAISAQADGGKSSMLSCGTFEIDEVGLSGPSSVVAVKALSSLVAKGLKRDKRTRGWERITLRAIAAQIAAEHGLGLYFEVDQDLRYQRVEQQAESDLCLLKRLCEEADLSLKIDGQKLIVYANRIMEARPPAFAIALSPDLSNYSFCSRTTDIYRACEVVYRDPETKRDRAYTFAPEDAPDVGQVLRLHQRVESLAAAMALAEKSLRRHNKFEVTGGIEMPGRTDCLAGLNFAATGFGRFDGKFFIESARHGYGRMGGYTTAIEFHRVLEAY